MKKPFHIGQFVRVGNDLGIIASLSDHPNVPEDHVGVWYGERNEANLPKVRTVPQEYCELVDDVEYYH